MFKIRFKISLIKSIIFTCRILSGIFIFLLCGVALCNSDDFNECPPGISELAYFAAAGRRNAPKNQNRFALIYSVPYSTGTKYFTENGSYETIYDLLANEDISHYEGVAIECRECMNDIGFQKTLTKIFNENGVKNLFFWPNEEWRKARQIFLDRTTGKVRGKITAAESGEPLFRTFVSTGSSGIDDADENGEYEIDHIEPGIVKLVTSRRDRESLEAEVLIEARKTIKHNFVLTKAKAACCKLEGEWKIELILTSGEGLFNRKPDLVGETASGRVIFSSKYKHPTSKCIPDYSDDILDEFGKYDIDLTSIFGKNLKTLTSLSDTGPLKEVSGSISHYDKVYIDFIPCISHNAISLNGKIVNNAEISGKWVLRGYKNKVRGTFKMDRVVAP